MASILHWFSLYSQTESKFQFILFAKCLKLLDPYFKYKNSVNNFKVAMQMWQGAIVNVMYAFCIWTYCRSQV